MASLLRMLGELNVYKILRVIMSNTAEVLQRMDQFKEYLQVINQGVEGLYDAIKQAAPEDISPETKAALMAKIDELWVEADKIMVDEPEAPQA